MFIVTIIEKQQFVHVLYSTCNNVFVMVIIRFRVQFVINLHEWVFQKAEIARAASASAISAY